MLLTRSRLCPGASSGSSHHLHVLSTPPAFVLSQDQTLHEVSPHISGDEEFVRTECEDPGTQWGPRSRQGTSDVLQILLILLSLSHARLGMAKHRSNLDAHLNP